jgi:hypothetical protein
MSVLTYRFGDAPLAAVGGPCPGSRDGTRRPQTDSTRRQPGLWPTGGPAESGHKPNERFL